MHTRILVVIAGALPFIFGPFPAAADEIQPVQIAAASDETLLFADIPTVVGASKYEQKTTEAPSSVSIVTSQDIRRYGYRTLADLLRSARSFFVTYDRNYSYVGVRGFGRPTDYNTRVLLLIDGHRVNDNIYDGAYFGNEALVDIDLVDRVEIIRGPGSSLYGSNAFFGVVNVITKRGRDYRGGENSGEARSYRAYKVRATYGDRHGNGVEALVSGSAYDSKGGRQYYPEYDTPATNNGIADHADYEQAQSFFGKISYHDLTVSGAHLYRAKGVPTASFLADFNDPRNRTQDERGYIDVKYERPIAGADVEARVFYDRYRYEGDYLYAGVMNKDLGAGDWLGGELKVSRKLFSSHHVVAGAEYIASIREDQENFNVSPYSVLMPKDARRSNRYAFYLQDEVALTSSLLLNAGVRYDRYYDTFGGSTNPRLGLIYNTAAQGTVKLFYGTAFRAPNAFELYWHSNTTDANPSLRPEKIMTTEIVYERPLTQRLRGSIAAYHYHIDDLITQTIQTTPTGTMTMFENVSTVRARGAELELDYRWANSAEGRVSYTLQRAEDTLTGQPLTNSPSQMVKMNVSAPFFSDRLVVGVEEQYMDRRRTEKGAYAPAFAVTNVTLFSPAVHKRIDLSASVYNLFDRRYGDPVSGGDFLQDTIRQDGRSYRLKLTYAF